MKENILCALRANMQKTTKYSTSDRLYFYDNGECIEMYSENQYTKSIQITQHKTWWGKEYQKEKTVRTKTGIKYYVSAYDREFEITKEEFDDIYKFRESEKIRLENEHIKRLCK